MESKTIGQSHIFDRFVSLYDRSCVGSRDGTKFLIDEPRNGRFEQKVFELDLIRRFGRNFPPIVPVALVFRVSRRSGCRGSQLINQ